MLSPADSDLAKRDEALTDLATLLDPDAFADALRSVHGNEALESAELTYLRYKPGTNCVAAYRVQAAGVSQLIYAKAHGPDATTKLRKALNRSTAVGLEGHDITVFAFPQDAKIRALARLGDPARRSALLARVLGGRAAHGDRPLHTLGYKPERRYVGRYGPANATGAALKFYAFGGFSAAATTCRALESRGVLQLPRKCGGSKRHRVLAFEWLPGRPLRDALADPDPDFDAVAGVGTALAELHAQKSAMLSPRRRETREAELRELAETLGFLCPSLSDLAASLAKRIASRLAANGVCRRPIHGDLYDKQILLDRGRVAILDLDEVALGDPREDLGLFIAHLERDALLGQLPAARVGEAAGSLLHGYQDATGERVSGLGAYVSDGLLRLAHYPFRMHQPNWPQNTQQILVRAEEILAGCR